MLRCMVDKDKVSALFRYHTFTLNGPYTMKVSFSFMTEGQSADKYTTV